MESTNIPHRLFVYGTLKRGFFNHYLLTDTKSGQSTFIGEAKLLERYPMVVKEKHGYPYLLPNKEGTDKPPKEIYGELFEVDDPMLKTTDALEKCPSHYTRTESTCVLLSSEQSKYSIGSSVSCYVYIKTTAEDHYYTQPYYSTFDHGHQYIPDHDRH